MPWAKVDDGWWCHPKVAPLSLHARGLWISTLCWASHQHTDAVAPEIVTMLDGGWAAVELVEAGLWCEDGERYVIVPWEEIAPPKRRRHIPTAVRRAVYDRDGWACITCGEVDDLTLDHVVPYSRGGPDTVDNLQTMCRPCNSRKGDA